MGILVDDDDQEKREFPPGKKFFSRFAFENFFFFSCEPQKQNTNQTGT